MAKYNRIRDLREDNDRTQQELADFLGTSTQHYGKYENGNAEIPFERAIMLAKFYDVSLDYIAGLTNNKKGLSSSDLSKEQHAFAEKICSMNENEKSLVRDLSKKFTDILK